MNPGWHLVVAGTYQQYREYLRENRLTEGDAYYVDNEHKLRGVYGRKIVLVGQYWLLPDWPAIKERIKIVEAINKNKPAEQPT